MAAGGLSRVQERMASAADRGGRSVDEVTLVAVSKGRNIEEMRAVYAAGQRDFGENRAHEMAAKVPEMPGDVRWHFVGSLQSRKAKSIGAATSLLHSMDRLSLARAWSRSASAPVLVQVNIAREPQKHGVDPDDLATLLAALDEHEVRAGGLMIIPPVPETPDDSRQWFSALRRLRDDLLPVRPALRELSMGMTDDFEVAIEEGATIIRVGRAIFEPAA